MTSIYEGKCPFCQHVFLSKRKRKYCSTQCAQDFNNAVKMARHEAIRKREGAYTGFRIPLEERSCPGCSTVFQQHSHSQKYCSPECRPRKPLAKTKHKKCPMCNRLFTTKRDRKTCSNRCNMRLRYQEDPEAVVKKVRDWEKKNHQRHRVAENQRKDIRRGRIEGRIDPRDWLRTLRRARGRCFYCDQKAPLTMDHVLPVSRGGLHTIGNVVPACSNCNYQKCDRTVVEWRLWKEKRNARTEAQAPRNDSTAA